MDTKRKWAVGISILGIVAVAGFFIFSNLMAEEHDAAKTEQQQFEQEQGDSQGTNWGSNIGTGTSNSAIANTDDAATDGNTASDDVSSDATTVKDDVDGDMSVGTAATGTAADLVTTGQTNDGTAQSQQQVTDDTPFVADDVDYVEKWLSALKVTYITGSSDNSPAARLAVTMSASVVSENSRVLAIGHVTTDSGASLYQAVEITVPELQSKKGGHVIVFDELPDNDDFSVDFSYFDDDLDEETIITSMFNTSYE